MPNKHEGGMNNGFGALAPPGAEGLAEALVVAGAAAGAGAGRLAPRVRSHCRFKNRDTEYVSDFGIKWMSSSKATM